MSKAGETPIEVSEGVEVTIQAGSVHVKGPVGEVTVDIPQGISVDQEAGSLLVRRGGSDKRAASLHGLVRSLLQNAVLGVVKAWEKRLEVIGTGYRVKAQGEDLVFEVGYSHPVSFKKVDGITLGVEGKNVVVVSGVNKQLVGQVAHQIRVIKKPDPYKGKGIRYQGEKIKLKPGKKAKAAGTA